MVLAYEDEGRSKKKTKKREMFEAHLMEQGLQLETELSAVSLEYEQSLEKFILLRTRKIRRQIF